MEFHHYIPVNHSYANETAGEDAVLAASAEDKELGLEAFLYFTGPEGDRDSLFIKVSPTASYNGKDWRGYSTVYDFDEPMSCADVEELLQNEMEFANKAAKTYWYEFDSCKPSKFSKDGVPYSISYQGDDAILLPTKAIREDGTASVTEEEMYTIRQHDANHEIEALFTKDSLPETYSEILLDDARGGRNTLCSYLIAEATLKLHDVTRELQLLIEGEPLTPVVFSRAVDEVEGPDINAGYHAIDRILQYDFDPESRAQEISNQLYDAILKLDGMDACFDAKQKAEYAERHGFHRGTKQEILETASRRLASSAFGRPNYVWADIARHLSTTAYPDNSDFKRAVQETIFPKHESRITKKEERLAKLICKKLLYWKSNTEYKAHTLANLAIGGESRKKEIQSIQRDFSRTR